MAQFIENYIQSKIKGKQHNKKQLSLKNLEIQLDFDQDLYAQSDRLHHQRNHGNPEFSQQFKKLSKPPSSTKNFSQNNQFFGKSTTQRNLDSQLTSTMSNGGPRSPRLVGTTQNLQMIPVFEWYFYPECALKNNQVLKQMKTNQNIRFEGFDILDTQSNQQLESDESISEDQFMDDQSEEEKSMRHYADDYYHVNSGANTPRTEYHLLNALATPQQRKNATPKTIFTGQAPLTPRSNGESNKKYRLKETRDSLQQFNDTELCKTLGVMMQENQMPFKYKTVGYLKKILSCPDIEEMAKDFRQREHKNKSWQHTEQINKDLSRTKILNDNIKLHNDVHRVIEFYCQQKNVSYCQGILEVLLPFLLLKQQGPMEFENQFLQTQNGDFMNNFDLSYVYAYFRRFVQLYTPNTLHAKFNGRGNSLPYLKCSLFLVEQLLQYHDKELYLHLKHYKIFFEMFATSWLITLFTRLVDFGLIYEVWEIFLFERDRFLIFYMTVAFLKIFRYQILKLTQFEKILKFLTSDIKIHDFDQLYNLYMECITIRSYTPLSFQIMVSKLGLFDSDSIISNEELEIMESFKIRQHLNILPKEITNGAQLFQNSTNNNKYLNLMVLSENEQAVYLCTQDSMTNEQAQKKLQDPIQRINELKLSCANEIKVGANVKYLLLDLRISKKPKLDQIFGAKVPYREINIESIKDSMINILNLNGINQYHLVLVMNNSNIIEQGNSKQQPLSKEQNIDLVIYKKVMENLKKRNHVSVLENGIRDLIK
ncbi:tbc domain containing protein [Stylonychia lemnae]|uniref:Tbc domain containing protein n=1 Tax=Stylonychia lemnae TaxID=5949 RepID=A0A078AZM1_STYLE|nr:tbc domain containing protein [Stylonychia lemnae]|eukprot:CDW87634.1 tbc domain containing protein [Stylonychia lemnae]